MAPILLRAVLTAALLAGTLPAEEAERIFLGLIGRNLPAEAEALAARQVQADPASALWWSYLACAGHLQGRHAQAVDAFVHARSRGDPLDRAQLARFIASLVAVELFPSAERLRQEAARRFPFSRLADSDHALARALAQARPRLGTPAYRTQVLALLREAQAAGGPGLILAAAESWLDQQGESGENPRTGREVRLAAATAALDCGDHERAAGFLRDADPWWRGGEVAFQLARIEAARGHAGQALALLEQVRARTGDLRLAADARRLGERLALAAAAEAKPR